MGKQSCLSGARGGALPSVLRVRPLTPSAEENVISPQVLHRLLLCLLRAKSWVPPHPESPIIPLHLLNADCITPISISMVTILPTSRSGVLLLKKEIYLQFSVDFFVSLCVCVRENCMRTGMQGCVPVYTRRGLRSLSAVSTYSLPGGSLNLALTPFG